MSLVKREMDATPDAVFAVLADERSYGEWVVGSKEVRDAEGHWPDPGATFHHTQGKGPVVVKDTTSVIESQRPFHLVLEVRAQPFVVSVVEMSLEPLGTGRCRVSMYEHPIGGWAKPVWNPLFDRGMSARNVECLRRLEKLAVERAGVPA